MSKLYPINDNPPAKLLVTLFQLNGALLTAGNRLVADLSLSSARWQVLGVIANTPVPLPIASIARNIGLTRQGVRQVVGELVKSGFARLETNSHHQRASLVVLTDEGTTVHATAKERWARWTSGLAEGMTDEELLAAAGLLQTMLERLDPDSSEQEARG
jgi:DNA-binding MarR family transcriptional regulator